jgi:hypothetical protein
VTFTDVYSAKSSSGDKEGVVGLPPCISSLRQPPSAHPPAPPPPASSLFPFCRFLRVRNAGGHGRASGDITKKIAYSLFPPFCLEYSSREDMEEALDTLDGTDLDGAREYYYLRE